MMIATVLFWSLALLVAQPFSLRLALLAFLLIVHIDLSFHNFSSLTTVGLENAIKAVALPVLLLVRVAAQAGRSQQWGAVAGLSNNLLVNLWLALCLYALVSVIWSPYPLSGVKLSAALFSHAIVFFVFAIAWTTGALSTRLIAYALAGAVIIAIVQTYVTGNAYGGGRLTSFVQAQGFGQYVVMLTGIVLWRRKSSRLTDIAVMLGGLGVILALNGSRSAALGAITMLAIWLLWVGGRQRARAIAAVMIGAAVLTAGLLYSGLSEPTRFIEVARVVGGDRNLIEGVGTFRWRALLYRQTFDHLERFDATDHVLGRGASSGGLVGKELATNPGGDAFRHYAGAGFAPNSVIHNEFLRTYYEFGMVWGILFALAALAGIVMATRLTLLSTPDKRIRAGPFHGPLVSTLPLLLLMLMVENILINSGRPGPTASLLVLGLSAAARFSRTASSAATGRR